MHQKRNRLTAAVWLVSICLYAILGTGLYAEQGGKSRFFLWKQAHLEKSKKLWKKNKSSSAPYVRRLIRKARSTLKRGPYTVTDKKYLPPSGDRHDFLAYGTYYWPNPNSPDGSPWTKRDGYNNPEAKMDWLRFRPMSQDLRLLALAYYFPGEEAYARHAATLLRTWFITPATRMNPNVNFGKVIPGVRAGGYSVAGFGYIFRVLYDSAGILEASPHWTRADKGALQQWTRDFIQWTQNSHYGEEERLTLNNHCTFYYMIRGLQAMYAGNNEEARDMIRCYINDCLHVQLLPDGTQPYEMRRANNFDYCRCNLMIAFDIAQLADNFKDIDLWNHETPKGGSLRRSLEFLLPYLTEQEEWPYFKKAFFCVPQLRLWTLLRRAALGFKDTWYEYAAKSLPHFAHDYREALIYPSILE